MNGVIECLLMVAAVEALNALAVRARRNAERALTGGSRIERPAAP